MTDSELIALATALSQRQSTLHARCNALQLVLIATVTALGRSSAKGFAQIDEIARAGARALYAQQDATHIETQRELETILQTCQVALTGKMP